MAGFKSLNRLPMKYETNSSTERGAAFNSELRGPRFVVHVGNVLNLF